MAKFFRFPFGVSGDRNAIPDSADPGGSVSYAQGFGPDYEAELGVDPDAKPVPRPETNQFNYDVTDNLRQYQLNGAPEWYDASNNGGVAISYPVNAIVRHNDVVYRSIVTTNTVEPGTDPAKWAVDGVAGQASTAVAGLTRYATDPEAVAKAATDRAITPANMAALWALLLNNPIFPEVLGSGLFTLTNPAGNVRIAAGTQWVHRGINTYTSILTDLATVASKTYHLRWTPVGGFALRDLSNGAYNPSAVPEFDATFDSTYDDMLVARVVTSAGNAATILPLVNKHQLAAEGETGNGGAPFTIDPSDFSATVTYSLPSLNWARRPRIHSINPVVGVTGSAAPAGILDGYANRLSALTLSRYGASITVSSDFFQTALGYYAVTRWNFAL